MSEDTQASNHEHRLDEVIAAYLRELAEGRAPSQKELLARHPDLAADLAEFFAGGAEVRRLAEPVRAVAAAVSSGGTVRYFGDYELHGEIARGGMGVVYRARQVSLNRPVALKMIKAGQFADEREVQRFRDEAEAAANLDHPNIVPIYEVGEHEGQQYFSMKLIEGGNLNDNLPRFKDRLKEIARLMITIARAIHHAHQRGILHRDLKPGNVLIDADGQPHVTDFGLAKRIEQEGKLTQSGAIVGTASYIAPEQAAGSKGLTIAADVYALGAILYELLTGRPPFVGDTPVDVILQVREKEPVPPRSLNPRIDRDLETICLKCLQKDVRKRYPSAAALAEDLRRFHAGEPIQARPVGAGERLLKWARRRPAVAALLGVSVAAALVLVGVVGVYSVVVQRSNRELARSNSDLEEANRNLGDERNRALAAEKEARERLELARNNLFTAQLMRVKAVYEHDPAAGLELLHDYNACPLDLRDAAWGWYAHQCQRALLRDGAAGQERAVLQGHTGHVLSVAFSSDGKTLASGSSDRTVRLWDVSTGQERAVLQGHTAHVYSVAFSGDGKTLASGSGDPWNPGEVRLWDVGTGQEQAVIKGHSLTLTAMAFSGDGKTLALGSKGEVRLWDVGAGQVRAVLQDHTSNGVTWVTFSSDGKTLAVGSQAHEVRLWDLTALPEPPARNAPPR